MYSLPVSSSANLPPETPPLTQVGTKDPRAGGTAFYQGPAEEGINNRRKENSLQTNNNNATPKFTWDNTIGQVLDVIA